MTEKRNSSDYALNNGVESAHRHREKQKYPKSVFFIIGNEFCERFSYYGMKAILVLYFVNVFKWTDDSATIAYHAFAMTCYFTPVLGAIIADSFWGKFKTIFYISIIYAIGNIALSIASGFAGENASPAPTYIGLLLIALGTGGIKPCVAAFGGDQFNTEQETHLKRFFSFFYISINAGSLLSTALTPILREDVQCFHRHDCFPLAFGVPAVLMIVALGLFIIGRFVTNYKMIPPAKGNIVVETVCVVFHALGRKMSPKTSKRDHWLDHADDKYDKQIISDVKALMRILFLYLPIPIFWALYDQTGSRWTLQAIRMDGDFFGVYRVKPDQIQVINPILIVLMIPLFEYVIYPGLEKLGIKLTPLKRISIGGVFTAVSFIICAFFQLKIETELPVLPSSGQTHLTIVNGLPCPIELNNNMFDGHKLTLNSLDAKFIGNTDFNHLDTIIEINGEQNSQCKHFLNNEKFKETFNKNDKEISLLLIKSFGHNNITIETVPTPQILEKPENVSALVTLVYFGFSLSSNQSFVLKNHMNNVIFTPLKREKHTLSVTNINSTEIHGGDYKLYLSTVNDNIVDYHFIGNGFVLKQGGGYIIIIENNGTHYSTKYHEIVKPNFVKMLWQIIPYIVITSGEIMFSITGLEFSYSQAPESMKSVLQAAWLLTVAFGNLIVAIVASAKFFHKQSIEFFFFAGLMILDMAVFALMAWFYVPYKKEITDDGISKSPIALSRVNGTNDTNGYNNKQNHSYTNDAFSDDSTKF